MSVLCICCRKVTVAFKHFAEGWVCWTCVLSATGVETVYTIAGQSYVEKLKVPASPRAEAIPIRRGKKT